MCHRGSYKTRDGTFTVLGDGTVPGGRGLGGPMWCAAGRVAGRAAAGRACTTATRSGTEGSELFRDAPLLPRGQDLAAPDTRLASRRGRRLRPPAVACRGVDDRPADPRARVLR